MKTQTSNRIGRQKALLMVTGATVLGLAGAAMVQPQRSFAASGTGSSAGATSTPGPAPGVKDPGVRAVTVGAGGPIAGLTPAELQFFQNGLARFIEVDSVGGNVSGEPGNGLGPGYNSNSCSSCHASPSIGGTSPSATQYPNIGPNPQILAATDAGATNTIPYFVTADGPVRESRFPLMVNSNGTLSTTPDGGVHDIYTITGRQDATGCSMAQPNYEQAQALNNIIFRIPTPVFGAGLIENIPDSTILANMQANAALKQSLGISGHPNTSGNDGTITKFGWKAQNKSLEIFAGEAYNVEMGVTNELFTNERNLPPPSCIFNQTPEDMTNFAAAGPNIPSDIVAFAAFMRFLAPPIPSVKGIPNNPSALSLADGLATFVAVHCDMCHTEVLQTGSNPASAALAGKPAVLFSDLLVHHMGSGLADNVSQGAAGPDEFRTAPLWGVGQRIFFLHDGRATPANGGLLTAIEAHASQGSEANKVISLFNALSTQQQQDLLNFLRSL